MNAGAVIVAAGMSSRMGTFKPMLSIGSITVAQRIVATFRQAGVQKIVVVTGYHAETLERHLAREGVIFLRNEAYETTQMFDSVKIGLAYLAAKCGSILLTPVDVPLFTARTVSALLDAGAELACPVYGGQTGHPILLPSRIVDVLLADSGERGLWGAVGRCGIPVASVEVPDSGILHDVDTPEDYRALLEQHNSQLVRPKIQVCLAKEKPFFDEKVAMLLTLVGETSSVRTACQRMQLSYSSGWNTINAVEAQLGCLLVERRRGGAQGGNSALTPAGRELLLLYEGFVQDVRRAVDELYRQYFSQII